MPLVQKGIAAFSDRMPKVISPKGHAIADYITAGTFFLLGIVFWRRNKRAALGAMACGAAEAATSLMTDYPGGVTDVISFPTHGKIDMGLAATCASMPNWLGFGDESEAKYFRIMGLNVTTVAALTDFNAVSIERREPTFRAA